MEWDPWYLATIENQEVSLYLCIHPWLPEPTGGQASDLNLPQVPSVSFSSGGRGSVVLLAFLHVVALAYRRVLQYIQHFIWLMPWRRTFFVWVWSRYLAGATWARPFSPFLFPSIYMVCWITCEVDFTWPCLLQLHPRLVSCSKTNKWSSEFMNERATIIKKAIPFLFFDSSLAVWNMD